ncbi:MAG: hypothetical protein HOP29_19880 [Phycisphaerales bacterium]|nr:hypothetical protein [Phycisphaerales bacterium]
MKTVIAVMGLAVLSVGPAGCAPRVAITPKMDHNQLDSLALLHYMAGQPAVTNDEACRAVLVLVDGAETPGTFDARRQALETRGMVRGEWNLQASDAVDRGTLAYMIFKGCGVRQGMNTWLSQGTGLGDRRYALRRCIQEDIMPYGLPYQIPTGGEVVRALSRADDVLAKKGAYEDKVISSPADVGP